MMEFQSSDLLAAARKALDAMPGMEQELNAADGQLGDGDTGGMLARLVTVVAGVDVDHDDVGVTFVLMAKAVTQATGSSLGTVCATGLNAIGRQLKGRKQVPLEDLGALLVIARDAMIAHGGASLGDKTVIDTIDAISLAVAAKSERATVRHAAVEAADRALDDFRGKPIRTGRAHVRRQEQGAGRPRNARAGQAHQGNRIRLMIPHGP